MNAYHYSVVHCRDGALYGEARNVGVLVVAPGNRAWLRRANVREKAHLVADPAAFVRAMLDLIVEEATEVARSGGADTVYDWLRRRSAPTEDTVFLGPPAIGIASDLRVEAARLATLYLGKPSGGSSDSLGEQVGKQVLRTLNLEAAFRPREFHVGPATWSFARVCEQGDEALVLQPLHFGQKTPENVLDAAFKNVGRFGELRRAKPDLDLVAVTTGPDAGELGEAFAMARDRMTNSGIRVVPPKPDVLIDVLRGFPLTRKSLTASA